MSILVKLAATAKQVVIAASFGTDDVLDAFLIAFLVPSFAVNVLAGSFHAAFMPTFVQVMVEQGQKAAQRLLSGVMVWGLLLTAMTSILLVLLFPSLLPLIGSGFSPEKQALTRTAHHLKHQNRKRVFGGTCTGLGVGCIFSRSGWGGR